MLRGRTFGAFPKCCKENYTIQSMSLPMQRTCSTIIWSLSSTFARSLWHSVIFTRCARHSCRQVIVRGYQYSCTSPTYFETPHEFLWLKFNNAIDSLLDRVRSSCDSIHGWNVFVYWVWGSMINFNFNFNCSMGPHVPNHVRILIGHCYPFVLQVVLLYFLISFNRILQRHHKSRTLLNLSACQLVQLDCKSLRFCR